MKQIALGDSGIRVSRLCYGTLTLGPAQAGLSPDDGGALLAYAYRQGVTFFDTAELYETYPHLRAGLRRMPDDVVVCTKAYIWDRDGATRAVEDARRALDRDVIDIFLLHEQESVWTMDGHREAFCRLLEYRDRGVIRAVGLSTHAVAPVRALTEARTGSSDGLWRDLDAAPYREASVVHPLLNVDGLGLLDGTADDMKAAVRAAHDAGLGVFGMKMLGGGNLLSRWDEATAYVLEQESVDAVAVGMQSRDEIDMNTALLDGRDIDPALRSRTRSRPRRLHIDDWCTGCGACIARCRENALVLKGGRAVVRPERCLLCGYCAYACPEFAIKVV